MSTPHHLQHPTHSSPNDRPAAHFGFIFVSFFLSLLPPDRLNQCQDLPIPARLREETQAGDMQAEGKSLKPDEEVGEEAHNQPGTPPRSHTGNSQRVTHRLQISAL